MMVPSHATPYLLLEIDLGEQLLDGQAQSMSPEHVEIVRIDERSRHPDVALFGHAHRGAQS